MALLADAVLIVHFLFVLFVVGGLFAIWAGAALGWNWVRNRRFRVAHLAAILFVMAESLVGMACPLTIWEDFLRKTSSGGTSFMQRWVGRLTFYDLPEWAFTLAYALFALAVLATFWLIRPQHHDLNLRQNLPPKKPTP
ncbi:hypothetical protein SCD_n02199 [Sulfuricella denitrificans skB26]|uniref:Transmembrane protein n=1 Tax=Sulfuricella denitrificans (strain DSM 22764 / NBRC 105220 / skB26) TaxID=1163617 RepID=S6ACZ1_SULDS|nr:DUF2784 domain-containing protein [Sulfuricella denitrificans]BAN36008.1 hypothetical protein SCD_n02199 [Sulfuricella denitrificans skB26]